MTVPPFTRCSCRTGAGFLLAPIADYAIESGYTRFMLFRCVTCGAVRGMPDENLDMALDCGTPETRRRLSELTKLH